jgi:hypothetical protein
MNVLHAIQPFRTRGCCCCCYMLTISRRESVVRAAMIHSRVICDCRQFPLSRSPAFSRSLYWRCQNSCCVTLQPWSVWFKGRRFVARLTTASTPNSLDDSFRSCCGRRTVYFSIFISRNSWTPGIQCFPFSFTPLIMQCTFVSSIHFRSVSR